MLDKEIPKSGIAHKVAEIFSWASMSITIETFAKNLDTWLNESPPTTLINLAYRIYDLNNDNKVDELDLYSIIYFFEGAIKPAKDEHIKRYNQQMFQQLIQVKAQAEKIETDTLFLRALSPDLCVI